MNHTTAPAQPSTDNPFKAANQLRKALKLAKVIVTVNGADSINDPAVRRLAETVAGVSFSSNTTWAMVAVLLEGDA